MQQNAFLALVTLHITPIHDLGEREGDLGGGEGDLGEGGDLGGGENKSQ